MPLSLRDFNRPSLPWLTYSGGVDRYRSIACIRRALAVDHVETGADALQIFDSWAGSLPEPEFDAWLVAPTERIAKVLKARHPG